MSRSWIYFPSIIGIGEKFQRHHQIRLCIIHQTSHELFDRANFSTFCDRSRLVTYSLVPQYQSSKMNVLRTTPILAIGGTIGAALFNSSIYDVKGGTRAVIFDRISGVQDKVMNEGTHFLVPWLQKSIIYDVRTKPRNISTTTGSKDMQMVSLTLRVLHRPEVAQLPKIYQVCHHI